MKTRTLKIIGFIALIALLAVAYWIATTPKF